MAVPNERLRSLIARFPGTIVQGGLMSAPLRNAAFVLFLGGILAYGAGFAWYMLDRFDLINLIRDVSGDDSFYYFQIAKNLAEGKFSTFDGGITRTNGYHPLWLFLITPFYWVFDKEAALFAIKAFEIMLTAGGVALVALSARLARLPWILLFAALPMLYQQHALFLGLEAAAALFMLGLLFLAMSLFARNPARWKWHLTVAAFALPWVRLEFAAVSVAATAVLLLIEWPYRERAPGASWRESARSISALEAITPLLGATAGILAYFAYNGIVFGGIVPVSGVTKQAWSQLKWEREGGYSLARNFQEILQIPAFGHELPIALEVCAYMLPVWWLARRSHSREDRLPPVFLTGVFGLAAGHLAKFAQSVLTLDQEQASWSWYFVPAYLMTALIVPVRCYVAIYLTRRFIEPRLPQAANIRNAGIFLVGAVFLFPKADFNGPLRFVDNRSEITLTRNWVVNSYMGTLVANRLLGDDSIVGSWDSGVIGYFSRFPVVNLDGVVNSYDYFRATVANRGDHLQRDKFRPLHREFGITHLANHSAASFEHKLFESRAFLEHRDERLQFKLGAADPMRSADPAAWFRQRMAPHFDYRSGDVGIVVDGRLAQAFAGDCAPDEMFVFYGANEEAKIAVSPRKNQLGFCTAATVLPGNAAPPIWVERMPASDYLARLLGDRRPVIRSDWDVYLIENGLVYVKDQCSPEAIEPLFFLHLHPADGNDLPVPRWQPGFDNLDFDFAERGGIFDGRCMATVALPEYAIARIDTGQYVHVEGSYNHLWEAGFDVVEPADDEKAAQ